MGFGLAGGLSLPSRDDFPDDLDGAEEYQDARQFALDMVIDFFNRRIGGIAARFHFQPSELAKFGPVELNYWVERANELEK